MTPHKRIKPQWDRVGGLSDTSKMPGLSYGLPAKECQTGSKLRLNPNSTCSHCYALKENYIWPNVQLAQYRRFDSVLTSVTWIEDMSTLINHYAEINREKYGFFRWHDSGDIQSIEHFAAICAICELTPSVHHWIPTREYRYIRQYVEAGNTIPSNLSVRVSAPFVNTLMKPVGECGTSSVHTEGNEPKESHICPASQQEGQCKDCRACWDKEIINVSYPIH